MIIKNKKAVLLGFISTVTASLIFATSAQADNFDRQSAQTSKLEAYLKFTKIVQLIEDQYVDEINASDIINNALKGMLSNLDAHSSFMDAKETKELQVQTHGEFGGLGITVGMKDGALTVIAPLEGTPADEAGIKAGDIILKIDKESTISMSIDDAVSRMRGKVGEPIDLAIVRKGELKPLDIHIIRGIITIESVYTKSIGDDVLYIRVASFDKKVAADVGKAIRQTKATTKGIVLDLRNNPGGLLDQAVGLVNVFVDSGDIVSQKGRHESDKKIYSATTSTTLTDVPLVVLINGGSASASEIVSGSLQDHKRAVIIGENTFGKGSVQVVMPITNTEAIKLTIARYYLPSGRTIQAVGVKPDIEVFPGEVKTRKNEFAIKEADLKKHLEEELEKVDGKKEKKKADTKEKKDIITPEMMTKDNQLKSAVDILRALVITKG